MVYYLYILYILYISNIMKKTIFFLSHRLAISIIRNLNNFINLDKYKENKKTPINITYCKKWKFI